MIHLLPHYCCYRYDMIDHHPFHSFQLIISECLVRMDLQLKAGPSILANESDGAIPHQPERVRSVPLPTEELPKMDPGLILGRFLSWLRPVNG